MPTFDDSHVLPGDKFYDPDHRANFTVLDVLGDVALAWREGWGNSHKLFLVDGIVDLRRRPETAAIRELVFGAILDPEALRDAADLRIGKDVTIHLDRNVLGVAAQAIFTALCKNRHVRYELDTEEA